MGTSNRADACAFTSEPQLSSRRRRRRDGLPRNLHACFDSLVRVPRDTPEKLAHVRTLLGPFFVTTLMIFCGSLGLVVSTWRCEVRGVIFHTTRWTQCPTRKCDIETVMASGAPSDTACGMMVNWSRLWLTAAEREVPSHGKETAWKSTPRRQQYPAARQLAHLACGVEICFRKVDVRWATRCFSRSLTRLPQSRARGCGLPRLTPLTDNIIISQQGGCTPLTNGKCCDCLVWNVDETC